MSEAIAMLHSCSANTGFNFVTQVPIPDTKPTIPYRSGFSHHPHFLLMGQSSLLLQMMARCLFGMFEIKFP
jgi:hypothetical protein